MYKICSYVYIYIGGGGGGGGGLRIRLNLAPKLLNLELFVTQCEWNRVFYTKNGFVPTHKKCLLTVFSSSHGYIAGDLLW